VKVLKKLNLGMNLIVILAAFGLQAEEQSTSKVKASDLGVKTEAQKDIDDEITNARLRATTGSKSKISIQTDMAYTGGSINKPIDKMRPELSPGSISEDYTKLSGSISGKYRINDNDSVNIGSGVGLLTPGFEGQRGQIENPYISYGKVFKSSGLQNVFSFSVTNYTSEASIKKNRTFELSVAHTILANLSDSKWQAGIVGAMDYEMYSSYDESNQGALHTDIALFPFAEYAFTDKYSFRTVYRGMTFYTVRDASDTYKWDEATQSMGFGMALTRDIYLYPNVQWVWRDIKADKTNVALSANINFF
jgi:hypothetical protein